MLSLYVLKNQGVKIKNRDTVLCSVLRKYVVGCFCVCMSVLSKLCVCYRFKVSFVCLYNFDIQFHPSGSTIIRWQCSNMFTPTNILRSCNSELAIAERSQQNNIHTSIHKRNNSGISSTRQGGSSCVQETRIGQK